MDVAVVPRPIRAVRPVASLALVTAMAAASACSGGGVLDADAIRDDVVAVRDAQSYAGGSIIADMATCPFGEPAQLLDPAAAAAGLRGLDGVETFALSVRNTSVGDRQFADGISCRFVIAQPDGGPTGVDLAIGLTPDGGFDTYVTGLYPLSEIVDVDRGHRLGSGDITSYCISTESDGDESSDCAAYWQDGPVFAGLVLSDTERAGDRAREALELVLGDAVEELEAAASA